MSHKGDLGPAGNAPALGVIHGEPIDVYHATDAWSKSKLDVFRKLPLLAFQKFVEKSIPREPMSDAFRIGQGAHALTLEGEEAYAAGFVIVPEDAPSKPTQRQREAKKPSDDTKAAIEWWDNFDKVNAGKVVIPSTDDPINRAIRSSVHSHPLASLLLGNGGEAEVTHRVKTDRYLIQCRPDFLNAKNGASRALVDALRKDQIYMDVGEPYACDFKTVDSLSEFDFSNFLRNFAAYGYHRQGPFYRGVIKDAANVSVDRFFFIAAEKKPPFQTVVYLPDDDANATGWQETVESLQRLNDCYDTGVWPGMPTGVRVVKLPTWYKSKEGGAW